MEIRDVVEVIRFFQNLVCLHVNLQDVLLMNVGDVRDVVVPALPFLFLKLDENVANAAVLDALHQVSGEAGDPVAKLVGGNDSNFLADAVVRVEIQGQPRVVLLDDDGRSLVFGLGSDATDGFGGKNALGKVNEESGGKEKVSKGKEKVSEGKDKFGMLLKLSSFKISFVST
jgi:hypothetical protein